MQHLDVFKLSIPEIDKDPKSWICVKGESLKSEIKKSVDLIGLPRKQLARILSENLEYALSPSEKTVYLLKEWIPLPIIKEILNILERKGNLSKNSLDKIKNSITNSIEFFKTNTLGSVQVKLPHNLSIPLCKLIGAHAADGSLTVRIEVRSKDRDSVENFLEKNYPNKKVNINFNKHIQSYGIYLVDYDFLDRIKDNLSEDIRFSFLYYFKLVDEYKESVEKFAEWFNECFCIKLQVKKHPKENDYFVSFQNKVIGRYFNEILKIQAGNKIKTIKEPEIIKRADTSFRKAFALGVMSFDGCVELDGTISLNTSSRYLLQSILDIIVKDSSCPSSLKDKISIRKGRLRTLKSLTSDEYLYLSDIFEPTTEKWYKVLEFAKGYKGKVKSLDKAIEILDIVFPLKWYKIIKIVKYRDIANEKVTGMKKAYLFNSDIKSWRIPYRPWLRQYVKLS